MTLSSEHYKSECAQYIIEITYYLVLVTPVNMPSLFSTIVIITSDTSTISKYKIVIILK